MLRRDDIGSLEPGKRADIAVWRTDGLELAGAADPVAGLVLSGPHRVDRYYVGARRSSARPPVRADEEESRGTIGTRREDSPHDLDPSSTPSAASDPAGMKGSGSFAAGDLVSLKRPTTTRHPRAGESASEPGEYRLVFVERGFFEKVGVDHRDRRRPRALPRPATRLFHISARSTAAVERRASSPSCSRADALRRAARERARPARPRAHARARDSPGEKKEVLDAHPAIGAAEALRTIRSGTGSDDDRTRLAELRAPQRGVQARHGHRFVVFVNRRPKAEIPEVLRTYRARDRPGARDGAR